LLKATEIVKKNYLKCILPYRKQTPEKFFENLAIDDQDWSGKKAKKAFYDRFCLNLIFD
jgi:hypothetical protein